MIRQYISECFTLRSACSLEGLIEAESMSKFKDLEREDLDVVSSSQINGHIVLIDQCIRIVQLFMRLRIGIWRSVSGLVLCFF